MKVEENAGPKQSSLKTQMREIAEALDAFQRGWKEQITKLTNETPNLNEDE